MSLHQKKENKKLLQTFLKTEIRSETFYNNYTGSRRQFNDKPVSGIEVDVEKICLDFKNPNQIIMERPIAIRGIVLVSKTAGRGVTPQPVAFDSLIKHIKSTKGQSKFRIVSPNSDRGHVMALELGGPNSKYNIIPQWNGFQERGDWRKLEQQIKKDALLLMRNQNSLYFEINLEYLNLAMKDLQEKLGEIFNFGSQEDFTEDKVKKCLQIFGTPAQYSYHTFPCNIELKKPRNHSLSISYVKYLYEVAKKFYENGPCTFDTRKILSIHKTLSAGWGSKKLSPTDLLNYDEAIFGKDGDYSAFFKKGVFLLSTVTEEDL